jgi:hypothetical protein
VDPEMHISQNGLAFLLAFPSYNIITKYYSEHDKNIKMIFRGSE